MPLSFKGGALTMPSSVKGVASKMPLSFEEGVLTIIRTRKKDDIDGA